jgi:hypothetical protein
MAASVLSKSLFDPMMRTFAVANLNPLGQGTQMVAAIAATFDPHPLADRGCELAYGSRSLATCGK